MTWVLQAGVLLAVGFLLRYALHMDAPKPRPRRGLPLLSRDREPIYEPVARDLEIEAGILGVSLNDAFEERDSGNAEIAWRLVRLSASEWSRLAETTTALLSVMAKYMPVARVSSPVRRLLPERFKSQNMIDYVRLHEMLQQFVFRSKLRFQLHVRILRRAVDTLSAEFRHLYRTAERSEERSPELWRLLDLHFHDLDLLMKETLLAYRTFLLALPDNELRNFATDLRAQLPRVGRPKVAA
jgi:hypothetical protein